MKIQHRFLLAGVLAFLPICAAKAQAQPQVGQAKGSDEISSPSSGDEEGTAKVAKQLANPIADLVSVPFQSNIDVGLGPNHNGLRYTLNIQPVIPFKLNDDWLVISRTVLPFIDQEKVTGTSGGQYGLGDLTQSFFLSPTKPQPGGIIWGVGPVLFLPTATDSLLGTEKVGAGPTLVLVKQTGGLTCGILTNQIWSFAGNDHRRDVDATLVQPFVFYTTKTAFTAGINMESSYDWNANQWTIPINLQFSQVVKVDGQLMSIGIGGRSYVERPNNGPDWGARLTVTFLFPVKR